MVTEVAKLTEPVLIGKLAVVAPAGTVTVLSTLATLQSLLDNTMVAPPLNAGALSVTAPVLEILPVTVDGFTLSEIRDVLRLKRMPRDCEPENGNSVHTRYAFPGGSSASIGPPAWLGSLETLIVGEKVKPPSLEMFQETCKLLLLPKPEPLKLTSSSQTRLMLPLES